LLTDFIYVCLLILDGHSYLSIGEIQLTIIIAETIVKHFSFFVLEFLLR
jgi:hypothetical protein